MRKVIYLFFVVMICFIVLPTASSANDVSSNDEINERLIELGFKEEYISVLNEETKLSIANEDAAEKLLFFKRNGQVIYDEGNLDDPMPDRETGDIAINVVAIDLGMEDGSRHIKLLGDYQWSDMPFFRFEDRFSLSWDSRWYGQSWGMSDIQDFSGYFSKENELTNPAHENRGSGVEFAYDLKAGASAAYGTAIAYLIDNQPGLDEPVSFTAFDASYEHFLPFQSEELGRY
ncbi:hypothetical protein [Jeotgalibacillus sp. R-1-5s-1]|uniref:hypothetical protein n=1 Tax=Jeotgalibacillus sp. R-1-5s-1 TaxID=2555897 RepID=UPI00106B9D79|nr:hypothetical protein [Jeotgalibacillus sp. R-1-5s-1]TFD94421.1 hypothetical protein E2491_13365 [Jeotgalibacillus sp. R-1-5s-1]